MLRRMQTPRRQSRTAATSRAAPRGLTRRRLRPTPMTAWGSWMPQRGLPSRSLAHWNRKQEGRTWTVIRLCPEMAAMSLDDGAADGEADTHAVALRRVEGFEELGHVLRVDADAGIAHAHAHKIAVLLLGFDQ